MNATKTNRKTSLYAAALVTVGVVAVTACGADGGGNQAHATAQSPTPTGAAPSAEESTSGATPNGAASRTAYPSATGAGTTGASTTDARPRMGSDCTTADLKAALKATGQEMNSKYFDLTLTNTTDGTCALKGYPGLSLTDSSGKRIGRPATRSNNGSAENVVLKAGRTAHAVVQTPDRGVTDGKCWAKPSRVKVYPPNNTAFLTTAAPGTLEVCGNTFTVGPFTARAL
ncbi:DUF4232 domain-containing protein [Streptomyces sp. NPDC057694]|uniref:DUF4232 domain-containing protein n=1 Tax=Streptomyces sp. NPDC057694 TaxID=3346216 RepID=UPI0036B644F8